MTSVTLDQARAVVAAAGEKAADIGVLMNIAVVDAGNNLTTFTRQDGAWLGLIAIAQDKAYTARAFDMPTADLVDATQPGAPLYGIRVSNGGRIIVFPGGLPLKDGDDVIGAIGVSGGAVEHDQAVAEAGVAALDARASTR